MLSHFQNDSATVEFSLYFSSPDPVSCTLLKLKRGTWKERSGAREDRCSLRLTFVVGLTEVLGGRLSLLTPCDTHTGMSEPIATDHRPSDIYNRCYTASERAYVATDGFFDAHSDQPGDR